MNQKIFRELTWRRIGALACAAAMLLALVIALGLPECRNSFMALGNELFARSEAVNAYVYERFAVPAGTGLTAAIALFSVFGSAWLLLCFFSQGFVPAVLLALTLAAGQTYLGLSFPMEVNVTVYALLALALVGKRNHFRAAVPFAACLTVVCLAVGTLTPGIDPWVEGASERVRDWLSAAFEQPMNGEAGEQAGLMETRHENLRDLSEGNEGAREGQDYRLVTVEERQIARPHWIDYLRIALLCLMIPVLLLLPFAPFLWLNRQLKKIADRRACLDSDDASEAVRGGFALVIGYLDALGIGDENALYTERLKDGEVSENYADAYTAGAAIWQEAAYSSHPADETQRAVMLDLLEQTERQFYDTADWRTRLRLKYVCCLHE